MGVSGRLDGGSERGAQLPAGETMICEDRDFAQWRGGAEHVVVWAIDVDCPETRAMLAAARELWAGVLLPRYERQPHITIAYGGPLPASGPAPYDPVYTADHLAAARAAIAALRLSPFEVLIGGYGSFEMSPYLAVQGPELHALAQALGKRRDLPYVPHVTVGHYGVRTPIAEVLRGAGAPPPVRVRVNEVSLMRYDAADIAGPLTRVEAVRLG